MITQTIERKQNLIFQDLLGELKVIRTQLEKLLILIPEEELKEYENSSQIKRAYLNAVKLFPPK